MRNLVFVLSISLLIFSCSSSKRLLKECNKNPFEQVDSLTRASQVLNYQINTPKDWKKSKTSSGDWFFLNDEFIDSLGYSSQKANIYISLNKIENECKNKKFSIEDFLDYYIDYRSKLFKGQNFKYLLLEPIHKIYGKIYNIKFIEVISNKKSYVRSFFLFFQNNIGYSIQYVAEPKYYDEYLLEVENIINSFKILED